MWWRNSLRIAAVIGLARSTPLLPAALCDTLRQRRAPLGGRAGAGPGRADRCAERHAGSAHRGRDAERARFRADRRRRPDSPTHQFKVRMASAAARSSPTSPPARRHGNHRHRRDFTLTELATGKTVLTGSTFARVSSDIRVSSSVSRASGAARRREPRRQGHRREYPHAAGVVFRRRD